ncbi:hypothetical protein ONZ45_g2915 [Pleurotus djamor]|nr:hypothetical protein ONZ45_g2915 [Pleurotus djamor]
MLSSAESLTRRRIDKEIAKHRAAIVLLSKQRVTRTSTTKLQSPSRIEKEIYEHESAAACLSLQRNTHTAVNKLPEEVLSMIFVIVRMNLVESINSQGTARRSWSIIPSVCHHWRQIAMNTPSYWSTISLYDPDFALELLQRSGTRPSSITYPIEFLSKGGQYLPLMILLSLASHRLEEVNIFYDNDASRDGAWALARILFHQEEFVTTIQRLNIINPSNSGAILPDPTFDALPKLRSLKLQEAIVPYVTPFALPQLTSLQIDAPNNTVRLAWLTILLSTTPLLRHLRVAKLVARDSMKAIPVPASLPHLEDFHLVTSQIFDAMEFYKYVSLPSALKTYHLGIWDHDEEEEEDDVDMDLSIFRNLCHQFQVSEHYPVCDVYLGLESHRSSNLRFGLSHSDLADILFGPSVSRTFNINLRSGTLSLFSLSIPWVEGDDAKYLGLCDLLPTQHVNHLVLGGSFTPKASPDLASLDECFHGVSHLTVEKCCETSLIPLLDTLASADDTVILFPKIKTLSLISCKADDASPRQRTLARALLAFLKARRTLGTPVEKVEISDCTMEAGQMEELKDYCVVNWNGLAV